MLSEFELNMLKQTVAKKLGVSVDRLKVEFVSESSGLSKEYHYDAFFLMHWSVVVAEDGLSHMYALPLLSENWSIDIQSSFSDFQHSLSMKESFPQVLVRSVVVSEESPYANVFSGYSFQIV